MGSFGDAVARAAIRQTEAATWWLNYGESAPHLRKIAIKILSQTTSSSSCERNWSTFALIHTKQRNRMAQKKVERNVFIHYNVRLRLRNMKRARNQGEQEQYCPINLDYIFAEDDPLLPWLEHREKEKDVANSEEENYPDLVQRTAQTTQEEVIEVQGDSSATQSDPSHDGGEEDDDDDDDDGDNGDGGGGGGSGEGIGSTSETFVPSTYPYPHSSTSGDCGKSPMIEEEEEEEEEDEGEEDEDESGMDLIQRRSPWPSGYPNVYSETVYSQYPPQPPPVPPGAGSFSYFFGYPPQYGYGYGHTNYNTNNDDDDNIEEPPRHSFWW